MCYTWQPLLQTDRVERRKREREREETPRHGAFGDRGRRFLKVTQIRICNSAENKLLPHRLTSYHPTPGHPHHSARRPKDKDESFTKHLMFKSTPAFTRDACSPSCYFKSTEHCLALYVCHKLPNQTYIWLVISAIPACFFFPLC